MVLMNTPTPNAMAPMVAPNTAFEQLFEPHPVEKQVLVALM